MVWWIWVIGTFSPEQGRLPPKVNLVTQGPVENDIRGSVPHGHVVTSGWTLARLTALDLGFIESEAPGGWGPTMRLIHVCFSSEMKNPGFLVQRWVVRIELNESWRPMLICLKSPSSEFSDCVAVKCSTYCSFFPLGAHMNRMC